MASPAVDVATGITIAFGTSAFSAQITDVTPPAATREAINTSHQGTTLCHTFMPADLAEWGELKFGIHFNPDTNPPETGAVETLTITFPAGATWVWTTAAFMTGYESNCPLNGKMTGTVTVKVSGPPNITAGP